MVTYSQPDDAVIAFKYYQQEYLNQNSIKIEIYSHTFLEALHKLMLNGLTILPIFSAALTFTGLKLLLYFSWPD